MVDEKIYLFFNQLVPWQGVQLVMGSCGKNETRDKIVMLEYTYKFMKINSCVCWLVWFDGLL